MGQSFYKLRIPDDIAELIRCMHPDLKKKIRSALQTILTKPDYGKKLKDELEGLRSYRISRFRIIYRISSVKYIEIIAMGPRARIYEETYQILKRRGK